MSWSRRVIGLVIKIVVDNELACFKETEAEVVRLHVALRSVLDFVGTIWVYDLDGFE